MLVFTTTTTTFHIHDIQHIPKQNQYKDNIHPIPKHNFGEREKIEVDFQYEIDRLANQIYQSSLKRNSKNTSKR